MLEAPRSRKFQAILTGVLLRVGQENLPKRWILSSALLFPLGQKWELIRHLDLHKFCSKQKYSGTGLEIWWQGGNVCDEISWNKHTEGEVSWESLTDDRDDSSVVSGYLSSSPRTGLPWWQRCRVCLSRHNLAAVSPENLVFQQEAPIMAAFTREMASCLGS